MKNPRKIKKMNDKKPTKAFAIELLDFSQKHAIDLIWMYGDGERARLTRVIMSYLPAPQ